MKFKGDQKDHEVHDNIQTILIRKLFFPIKKLIALLPGDLPMYIYVTLFKPPALRNFANSFLQMIIPRTINMPEGELCLNKHDPVVSGAIFLGVYEQFFLKVFRNQLNKNMTVVDIGANLGLYTLVASFHVEKVIAFEPEEDNAQLLNSTIRINKLKNVHVVKKGLGDQEGPLPLFIHPYNKGKHTLLNNNEIGAQKKVITISTLDKELELLKVFHVDLIKLDIEGWEAKAMRGAEKIIERDHPVIMFEFSPERISAAGDNPQDIFYYLNRNGYKLFYINEIKKDLELINFDMDLTFLKNNIYINVLARI